MNLFDVILLIALGGFVLYGFWFGIIHSLGVLVGTIVGAFLAGQYYDEVARWIQGLVGGSLGVWNVVIFLLIFALGNRFVGFLFWLIERVFNVLTVIPFLKTINRLAGAILGLVEGVLVIGLTLYVAERYPVGVWFLKFFPPSIVAKECIRVANILVPLLPEALRALKSLI